MLGENGKNAIVERLMQIVAAESTTVQTKNGPVEDQVTADKNSLTAAKSLGDHVKFLKNDNGNDDTGGVSLSVKDQNAILDRLMQILSKQTVTLQSKNGPVEDEVTADKNSIAAAKLMIGMQAIYQKHDKEDADIVRLNENDQTAVVERLMQILSKRSVIVQTKNGPAQDRSIADKNALTSASLLIALQDQWLKRQPGAAAGTAGLCASPGTAGLCASDDGFRIGESHARSRSVTTL